MATNQRLSRVARVKAQKIKKSSQTWKRGKSWIYATSALVALGAGTTIVSTGTLAQADTQTTTTNTGTTAATGVTSGTGTTDGSGVTVSSTSTDSTSSTDTTGATDGSGMTSESSSTSSTDSTETGSTSGTGATGSTSGTGVTDSTGTTDGSGTTGGTSSTGSTSSTGATSGTGPTESGAFTVENTVVTVNGTWNPTDNYLGVTINGNFYAKSSASQLNLPTGYKVNYQDNVNTTVSGTYQVTYTLLDPSGNTVSTGSSTVIVQAANTSSTTGITGKDLTLHVGDTWNAVDNYVSATIDGTEYGVSSGVISLPPKYTVSYTSSVNMKVAGAYTVTYTLKDPDGNVIATTTQNVTVLAGSTGSTGATNSTGGTGNSGANDTASAEKPVTNSPAPDGGVVSQDGSATLLSNSSEKVVTPVVSAGSSTNQLPATGDSDTQGLALTGGLLLFGATTLYELRRRRSN